MSRRGQDWMVAGWQRRKGIVFRLIGLAFVALATGCAASADAPRAAEAVAATLGREVRTMTFADGIRTIAWSHNGRFIAAANDVGNRIRLYDLEDAAIRWTVRKGGLVHEGLAFSPDDQHVFAGAVDDVGEPKTWEMMIGVISTETGRARNLSEPRAGEDINYASRIALSTDGKALIAVIGWRLGRVYVFDTATLQVTHRLGPFINQTRKAVMGGFLALDAGRDIMVFGDTRGNIETWRLSTNTKLTEFQAGDAGLTVMLLDPASGRLFTGSNSAVEINNPQPGEALRITVREEAAWTAVRAWNPLTGERLATYGGPGNVVGALALSPDGRYLVAVKGSGLIPAYLMAWEAATGRRLATVDFGKGHWLQGLAFSPDGRRLACAKDKSIHIIELDSKVFP